MTDDERYRTVLNAAAVLYANGQSTQMTQTAVARLNRGLDLHTALIPSWPMLILTAGESSETVLTQPISPTGINMRRVATLMKAIDRAQDGPLELPRLERVLTTAGAEKTSSTAAFTVACATGASALAVIFGASHLLTLAVVAAGAAAGGLLRRGLGRIGVGPLVQVFGAAAIAGAIGAAATHLDLGASTALVAVCQAMVLVPGPHVLNGALDLLDLRLSLGLARLGYSALLLAAISGGLVVGLSLGGQTLAVAEPVGAAPFYLDVLAAGIAAASYPVYFSMPWRMIGWPIGVGALAHAVHWWVMHAGASLALAAFASCLLVGAILVPVSHYMRIPFAGIGFASVVALVPGVYVFRTLSGFVLFASHPSAALLSAATSDLIVASITVTGMAIGLALPMHLFAQALSWR